MEYQNNFYGTPKSSLNADSYIIVDPYGLGYYKQNLETDSLAFYLYCSKEEREHCNSFVSKKPPRQAVDPIT